MRDWNLKKKKKKDPSFIFSVSIFSLIHISPQEGRVSAVVRAGAKVYHRRNTHNSDNNQRAGGRPVNSSGGRSFGSSPAFFPAPCHKRRARIKGRGGFRGGGLPVRMMHHNAGTITSRRGGGGCIHVSQVVGQENSV